LNCLKRNLSLILSSEYLFFWALGITAGIYAGSSGHMSGVLPPFLQAITIFLLLIAEILIVAAAPLSYADSCHDRHKVLVFIIIPFLMLFLTGNFVAEIYKSREENSIFLKILENGKEGSGVVNDVVIEGRVSNHPVTSYGKLYFLFAADRIRIEYQGDAGELALKAGEIIDVKLAGMEGESIRRDDYLAMGGSLEKNQPGKKAYGSKNRDIAFETDYENTQKIGYPGLSYKLFALRSRMYGCLKEAFYRYLESENAPIAEALILGNRNNVPDYISDSFRKCGLTHLFAISGLHLSFFVSLIYLFLKRTGRPIVIFWAVVIFLFAYNFLIGEKASALRASTMAVFVLMARGVERESSYRIILYMSYIAVVACDPFYIYDIGFWMTFISVAALVYAYPVFHRLAGMLNLFRSRIAGFFLKIILATVSIQAALFPLLTYFFGEVSLISVIASAIVIPAFYPLLFILIISSLAILIWPPLGCFILKPGNIFTGYIVKIVRILARFDYPIIGSGNFPEYGALVYYPVFIFVLVLLRAAIKRTHDRKWEF
jgi:ComEC/Rec2-related protein